MAKKTTKTQTKVDTTQIHQVQGNEYETVHSGGFPPMWVPENNNEVVVIIPTGIRNIAVKVKGKKDNQENYLVDARYMSGNGTFVNGSGSNRHETHVTAGDTVTVPLSYNLMGDFALATQTGEASPELSKLAKHCAQNDIALRIEFLEKVKLQGGRTVKQFIIQAPRGVKQQLL